MERLIVIVLSLSVAAGAAVGREQSRRKVWARHSYFSGNWWIGSGDEEEPTPQPSLVGGLDPTLGGSDSDDGGEQVPTQAPSTFGWVGGPSEDSPDWGGSGGEDPPPCGGFAGLQCPDDGNNYQCVDDPSDGCIPAQGGADCMGICVLTPPPPVASPVASPTSFAGSGGESPSRGELIEQNCSESAVDRSAAILSTLSSISSASTLQDNSTPQYEAFAWIVDQDDLILCSGDSGITQRYILALIYFALNGSGWLECSAVSGSVCTDGNPWLDGSTDACGWFGITCDDDGHVSVIKLKANNLSGELPGEIFSLPALTGLSMDHNKLISGVIPDAIANADLTYIELDDNDISGTIPSVLYSMHSLKAIDLNGNRLSGTISNDIGLLGDLMVLQLENNELSGDVPAAGLSLLGDMCKCDSIAEIFFLLMLEKLFNTANLSYTSLPCNSAVDAAWQQLDRVPRGCLRNSGSPTSNQSWISSVLLFQLLCRLLLLLSVLLVHSIILH